jgi:hypothetical protein
MESIHHHITCTKNGCNPDQYRPAMAKISPRMVNAAANATNIVIQTSG